MFRERNLYMNKPIVLKQKREIKKCQYITCPNNSKRNTVPFSNDVMEYFSSAIPI